MPNPTRKCWAAGCIIPDYARWKIGFEHDDPGQRDGAILAGKYQLFTD